MVRSVAAAMLLSQALVLAPAGPAAACAFHTYTPGQTVIDRMIASPEIVLARADPDNPFRYEPVEALRGNIEYVEIPILVDTPTRRRLADNPDDVVLFVRDGLYGPWVRAAYLDGDYRAVIERALPRLEAWEGAAPEDVRDRFEIFAGLQGHANRDLRLLALAELDQASYAVLSGLDLRPSAEALMEDMGNLDEFGMRPIRILLLGFSGNDAAREFLRSGTDGAGGAELGPRAAALMEIDGVDGVARLAENYLADRLADPVDLESVIEAMALHSSAGEAEVARAIAETLAFFLPQRPELAPMVARRFGQYNDWSQASVLAALLDPERFANLADLMQIGHYVTQARTNSPADPPVVQ